MDCREGVIPSAYNTWTEKTANALKKQPNSLKKAAELYQFQQL
jgi:hypothetical protein